MLLLLPQHPLLAVACSAHPDFCEKRTVAVAVIWDRSLLRTLAFESVENGLWLDVVM